MANERTIIYGAKYRRILSFRQVFKVREKAHGYLPKLNISLSRPMTPTIITFLLGCYPHFIRDDNFRDFQTTYGFTRINGNTITTGRIVTSDGECYPDLDGNKFRIGDASSSIDWNVSRNNAITLKNVSVVSESGDVSPLGVYRGTWNASYVYYPGDEVSYTENGATCTYRYIHPTPTKGHKPTDSTYWAVVAKGANGVNADSNKLVYCYSFDKPAKPTYIALIPTDGVTPRPRECESYT